MNAPAPASAERPRARRRWRALGVAGELLTTLGLLVLLFVAWQVWWVTGVSTAAAGDTVRELTGQFTAPAAPSGPTSPAPQPKPTVGGTSLREQDLATGAAFAIVTVPRFGNGPQPVLQGTAVAQLDRGVGHQPGTALPGRVGNFATAGHRDTYSHPYNLIDTLRQGDAVVVEVADGWAIYRVQRWRIVEPSQVEVYAPVPDRPGVSPTQAWMTLVACEPHWTAQRRWVVHALLEQWVPRTPQAPTAAAHPQVTAALAPPAGA